MLAALLLGSCSAILFLAAAGIVSLRLGLRSRLETVLAAYVVLLILITAGGYVLDRAAVLGSPFGWGLLAAACAVSALLARGGRAGLGSAPLLPRHSGLTAPGGGGTPSAPRDAARVSRPSGESMPFFRAARVGDWVVTFSLAAFAVLGLTSLVVSTGTAPHVWDVLTYHLPRAVRYVENGSSSPFGASYWAEELHAKGSAVLKAYLLTAFDRRESVLGLPQLAAWLATSLGVAGLASGIGASRRGSLVSMLAFGLATESLMQASTSQNDLLTASHLACGFLFFHRFRLHGQPAALALSVGALMLGAGTKATFFLALPSLLLAVGWQAPGAVRRHARLVVLASTLGFLTLLLPSGYLDNVRRFGHPLGPEAIRAEHTFEGRSLSEVLGAGTRNGFRYGLDFLSPDGVPVPRLLRQVVREGPCRLLQGLGLDLESRSDVRAPFECGRPALAHEDLSSWGLFGIFLIWPATLAAAARSTGESRRLALAAMLFVLVNAFSGPYDPWRGRTFLMGAVFAAPLVGLFWDSVPSRVRPLARAALLAATLGSVLSVAFRWNSPLVSVRYRGHQYTSVLRLDRIAQLVRNRPDLDLAVRRFEALVPEDATVGTVLPEGSGLYPFFGPRLRRRLIPLNPWDRPGERVAASVSYLLFSEALERPRPSDVPLGSGLYLRKS